jgi:hypothetical protein
LVNTLLRYEKGRFGKILEEFSLVVLFLSFFFVFRLNRENFETYCFRNEIPKLAKYNKFGGFY